MDNQISNQLNAQAQNYNFSQESLVFLFVIYGLAVFIHFVALFVHAGYVIPLQIREANVKNGLRSLRVLMLASGLVMIALNIVSIFVLTSRFFIPAGDLYRYLSVFMVLLHAIGFLAFAIIKRKMYRTQYSDKQKELHEKIEVLEDAQEKKAEVRVQKEEARVIKRDKKRVRVAKEKLDK